MPCKNLHQTASDVARLYTQLSVTNLNTTRPAYAKHRGWSWDARVYTATGSISFRSRGRSLHPQSQRRAGIGDLVGSLAGDGRRCTAEPPYVMTGVPVEHTPLTSQGLPAKSLSTHFEPRNMPKALSLDACRPVDASLVLRLGLTSSTGLTSPQQVLHSDYCLS